MTQAPVKYPPPPGHRKRAKRWKFQAAKRFRRNPTPTEKLLWTRLRKKQLGARFHRHAVILGYIADFYCPSWRFVVEVDGDSHLGREPEDARRDRALARRGFRTLRLPAALVEEDLEAAVARICAANVGRVSYARGVNGLIDEAHRMPEESIAVARGISEVRTPAHLIPLRDRVRKEHHGPFAGIQAAIDERFRTSGARDDYVNVFYAAAEMALMAWVGRDELPAEDRATLRELWEALLAAN